MVLSCYHRFNVNYQGPHAPASSTSQTGPTPPTQAMIAAPSRHQWTPVLDSAPFTISPTLLISTMVLHTMVLTVMVGNGQLERGLYKFPTSSISSPTASSRHQVFLTKTQPPTIKFFIHVISHITQIKQLMFAMLVVVPKVTKFLFLCPLPGPPLLLNSSMQTCGDHHLFLLQQVPGIFCCSWMITLAAEISTASLQDSTAPIPSHTMITRSKSGICKKKTYLISLMAEPRTVKQALQDPNWKLAMDQEYQALLKNQTWSLVPPLSNAKIIGYKWVFKLKHKLMAALHPVVKPCTIGLVLSIVVSSNWPIKQLDVHNAF
ncbi:hypothetical protein AAG906_017638 [Vitis piasezkii]